MKLLSEVVFELKINLQSGFGVGLSDYTMGVGKAVAAVVHGATVVEKHFTLSRAE